MFSLPRDGHKSMKCKESNIKKILSELNSLAVVINPIVIEE